MTSIIVSLFFWLLIISLEESWAGFSHCVLTIFDIVGLGDAMVAGRRSRCSGVHLVYTVGGVGRCVRHVMSVVCGHGLRLPCILVILELGFHFLSFCFYILFFFSFLSSSAIQFGLFELTRIRSDPHLIQLHTQIISDRI